MAFILTGPVDSGKTTLMKKLTCALKAQKTNLDGFLSIPVLEKGVKTGYDLFDLKEEESFPFLRTAGEPSMEKTGCFFILPGAMEKAGNIILRGKNARLLIVDEVGPLEINRRGFWPALEQVLGLPGLFLVAREGILRELLGRFSDAWVEVFHVRDKDVQSRILKRIEDRL